MQGAGWKNLQKLINTAYQNPTLLTFTQMSTSKIRHFTPKYMNLFKISFNDWIAETGGYEYCLDRVSFNKL